MRLVYVRVTADRIGSPVLPFRVGHGFDLHRLEEGDYKLIIGGIEIPHTKGCVAHSDGEGTASMRLHVVVDGLELKASFV